MASFIHSSGNLIEVIAPDWGVSRNPSGPDTYYKRTGGAWRKSKTDPPLEVLQDAECDWLDSHTRIIHD